MSVRYFALVFGIIYVLAGISGFIPGLLAPPATPGELTVESFHGRVFGIFEVNVLHSLVHILFGIWGIVAWRRFDSARAFARTFAIVFGVLTIMGLIPGLNTVFGLVPIRGHDVWLHAASAILAAYFGWAQISERRSDTVDVRRV